MKLYYPITVDLYNLYPLKKMTAQQNNIGRGAMITLTAAGAVIDPTNETVNLYARKPDGTVSYIPCAVVAGKIRVDFTNQMLAAPGEVQVELQMLSGQEQISTPIFILIVQKSNIDSEAVESTNEFTALQQALADVEELKEQGLKGDPGEAATIQVGTVTASEPGGDPVVTNSGTQQAAVFDFVIPRGQTGPAGTDFYGPYANFPRPGELNKLYIDDTVDPRLIYTWDAEKADFVLTGGAGGADGSSVDISVTLPASGWTGTAAPYQQTVSVPQLRETMTPLHFLAGAGDAAQYAYSLITDYTVGYGQITFFVADMPTVDIALVLKGVPAQELEYVDNTVLVPVEAAGFALDTELNRYTQTITVTGMTVGSSGWYDILRSGAVLTQAESEIMANITDVQRQDGAIKIVCLAAPTQDYTLVLYGTYKEAAEGDTLLANMQGWFSRVEVLESDVQELNTSIEFELTVQTLVVENSIEIIQACVRNGVVFITAKIKAGSMGVNRFLLPSQYLPPTAVAGSFSPSGNNADHDKVYGIIVAPNGTFTIWLKSEAIVGDCYASVVYVI